MSNGISALPPFDPELEAALESVNRELPSTITPDLIGKLRAVPTPSVQELIGTRPIQHREQRVAVAGGEIIVSIFSRNDHSASSAGVYYTHGGGMITGDRFNGAAEYLAWVDDLHIVVVAVEYRLAPEHPDPTPVDDCYLGLVWMSDNAEEIGIEASRIVIAGASAGGGLAAGVSLRARDLGTPHLAGSLLVSPMIDDRSDHFPSQQISGIGVWDRTSNDTGWDALLGARRGTDSVSHYASPARAGDLSGLPPTYVDCATTEVFRDEDVAYASRIWAQGGLAELHVWPGGFHGFDALAPAARLSREARAARVRWLKRVLAL